MRIMLWTLVLFVLLAVSNAFGHDGHPTDKQRQIEWCNIIAGGAQARAQGINAGAESPTFVWIPAKDYAKMMKEQSFPTTGIVIRDDGEDADGRKVWEEPLAQGWKAQDQYMRQHEGHVRDPKQLLEECISAVFSNSLVDEPPFEAANDAGAIPVASSGRIRDELCKSDAAAGVAMWEMIHAFGKTPRQAQDIMAKSSAIPQDRLARLVSWIREFGDRPKAELQYNLIYRCRYAA